MSSQLIIKSVLLICVAGLGWMMLRSPGGTRHQAERQITRLARRIALDTAPDPHQDPPERDAAQAQ